MFGVQVEWSDRFGGVPVYVQAADREWLQRDDPVVTIWEEKTEVLPELCFIQSAATSLARGCSVRRGRRPRRAASGDTVACTPDEHWVSFMRRTRTRSPLSAAVVAKVADRVLQIDFDRLYHNFGGKVRSDAEQWVRRSADRCTSRG